MIADEADVDSMADIYSRCIPAYRGGFSTAADVPAIYDDYIYERIVLHYGYRIVVWYLNARTNDKRALRLAMLQKIYELNNQ